MFTLSKDKLDQVKDDVFAEDADYQYLVLDTTYNMIAGCIDVCGDVTFVSTLARDGRIEEVETYPTRSVANLYTIAYKTCAIDGSVLSLSRF